MSFGIAAATWLTAGATVGGGLLSSRSAKKAANAQANSAREANETTLQAQREAMAFQQKQADQARSDSEPWRIAGGNALTRLTAGTADGGEYMRNFGAADFQADPGYQFRLAEGMRGLTNSASARGGILSGAALKAASAYNQNMGSQEWGNANNRFNTNRDAGYNKLANLAGIGQTVANQNGQNAMQLGRDGAAGMMDSAASRGRNMIGAGDARASGYMAQGNVLTGMMNQGVSLWNNRDKPPGYGTPNASNITPDRGWG